MPAFIANRLQPPPNVIPLAVPPIVTKGMLFLENPGFLNDMLFLDSEPMLFLGG